MRRPFAILLGVVAVPFLLVGAYRWMECQASSPSPEFILKGRFEGSWQVRDADATALRERLPGADRLSFTITNRRHLMPADEHPDVISFGSRFIAAGIVDWGDDSRPCTVIWGSGHPVGWTRVVYDEARVDPVTKRIDDGFYIFMDGYCDPARDLLYVSFEGETSKAFERVPR